MKPANRFMLLVGVALAAVSFVAVLALSGFGRAPTKTNPDVTVVVAASDLVLGAQITAEMVSTTTKPQNEAVDTYQDPQAVVGEVIRRAVAKGTVLTTDDFQVGVTIPELVRSLPTGLRAIAVPLNKVDSVGALLQPGDYVDVLISMNDPDELNPIVIPNPASPSINGTVPAPYISLDDYINNTSVKVVVQNVQVLSTITPTPANSSDSSSAQATPQPDMVVLLAVTPQQAEVVRFAQLDGNISLVLRAPSDSSAPAVDTTGITLKELVDQYGVLPPAPVSPVTP